MSLSPRTYHTSYTLKNGSISPRGALPPQKLIQNGYTSLGKASTGYSQQRQPVAAAHVRFNPLEFHGNDIVELNVGGLHYATTYLVLAESKSPYFKSIFKMNEFGRIVEIPDSITKDRTGRIFINRDGELFRFVLQYLRDGPRVALPNDINVLKMLRREAEFFSLQDFIKLLDQLIDQHVATTTVHRQSLVNEEMVDLLRKLSQQLNTNNFSQMNGIRR